MYYQRRRRYGVLMDLIVYGTLTIFMLSGIAYYASGLVEHVNKSMVNIGMTPFYNAEKQVESIKVFTEHVRNDVPAIDKGVDILNGAVSSVQGARGNTIGDWMVNVYNNLMSYAFSVSTEIKDWFGITAVENTVNGFQEKMESNIQKE